MTKKITTDNFLTDEDIKQYYILAYPVLKKLVRDFLSATGQTMITATVVDFVDWVIEQT